MASMGKANETTMECDDEGAAIDAVGGKRPATAASLGEPPPTRQLTFADVEDAISILLMDLTDESREGGAIEGVPTNPSLVDDSIQSGPWFFGFENQWVAMQIAAAADGKLIVDTADSSLVCNLTTLKTSKDEGAHRLFEASGFWMELYVPKDMVGHINPRSG
ncbi:hypothetical protein AB1Y20_018788 [Prymnesium parvum]|uniref:Uncharacterized protein n=1 Tax=Prymnesium parvum TaxID=97485 RepID=A0AB34JTH4_PRYPA